MNHNSPAEVRAALRRLGVEPKKRWGQNFMLNPRTRSKLVSTLGPRDGDTVWEIGPGLGAVTGELLPRCARLVLFEVDHGMIRHLQEELVDHPQVVIVPGDFLRTWQQAHVEHGPPDRIIGNLPYSCSSAIIAALVQHDAIRFNCVFTVQRELAQRLVAKPGSRAYSSLSVLCQCLSEIRTHGELAPGTFFPVPEVTSAVIEVGPRQPAHRVSNRSVLFTLIRAAFQTRRKTLRNNLLSQGGFGLSKGQLLDAVEAAGVDAGCRAEELTPATIVQLANVLTAAGAAVDAVDPLDEEVLDEEVAN